MKVEFLVAVNYIWNSGGELQRDHVKVRAGTSPPGCTFSTGWSVFTLQHCGSKGWVRTLLNANRWVVWCVCLGGAWICEVLTARGKFSRGFTFWYGADINCKPETSCSLALALDHLVDEVITWAHGRQQASVWGIIQPSAGGETDLNKIYSTVPQCCNLHSRSQLCWQCQTFIHSEVRYLSSQSNLNMYIQWNTSEQTLKFKVLPFPVIYCGWCQMWPVQDCWQECTFHGSELKVTVHPRAKGSVWSSERNTSRTSTWQFTAQSSSGTVSRLYSNRVWVRKTTFHLEEGLVAPIWNWLAALISSGIQSCPHPVSSSHYFQHYRWRPFQTLSILVLFLRDSHNSLNLIQYYYKSRLNGCSVLMWLSKYHCDSFWTFWKSCGWLHLQVQRCTCTLPYCKQWPWHLP